MKLSQVQPLQYAIGFRFFSVAVSRGKLPIEKRMILRYNKRNDEMFYLKREVVFA